MLTILISWANIQIQQRKTEALLEAGREVGLEVNTEKI